MNPSEVSVLSALVQHDNTDNCDIYLISILSSLVSCYLNNESLHLLCSELLLDTNVNMSSVTVTYFVKIFKFVVSL